MTIVGTGTARSRITSKGSPRRSFAMHSLTSSRSRGSQAATRRGVKPRFTMRRRSSWLLPSDTIRCLARPIVSMSKGIASAKAIIWRIA